MTIPLPKDDDAVSLQGVFRTIGNGKTVVTTHGTAVVLAASTECKRIDIVALQTNTKQVAIGSSSVSAQVNTESGVILQPGGSYTLFITNLANIFIDSLIDGEGVTYCYFQ